MAKHKQKFWLWTDAGYEWFGRWGTLHLLQDATMGSSRWETFYKVNIFSIWEISDLQVTCYITKIASNHTHVSCSSLNIETTLTHYMLELVPFFALCTYDMNNFFMSSKYLNYNASPPVKFINLLFAHCQSILFLHTFLSLS